MEIKNLNNRIMNTYKSVASSKSAKDAGASASKASVGSFDKVEFDFGRSIDAAKANIASGLDAEANLSRIEELQKAYSGDNCPVSSAQIADAIVG